MQMNGTNLTAVFTLDLACPVNQLRAVPVQINSAKDECVLVAYSGSRNVDPWYKYMILPSDTLKLAMVNRQGELVWQRDLGRGVIPGIWFFPFFPLDLDGDGVEEVWFVSNPHPDRPFNSSEYVLECVNPLTGTTIGQWPWPHGDMPARETMSHAYRFFVFGGRVHGEPVLVTAQGTYASMHLQGWSPGMRQRWSYDVAADAPGARGSHMTAIVDWNNDGVDEVFWGERCIALDSGRELFCLDRDTYRGHSDVVQPVYNWRDGNWSLYTIREGDIKVPPRVCCYDQAGRRIWGHIDEGHMHSGWVARMDSDGSRYVGMAAPQHARGKGVGNELDADEYYWDLASGEVYAQRVSLLQARPIDIDGDGIHEFAGDGRVIDSAGTLLGRFRGRVALIDHFLPLAGEHLLTYDTNGVVTAYANAAAKDTEAALARYAHPFYQANRKLTGCGYNNRNLSGV